MEFHSNTDPVVEGCLDEQVKHVFIDSIILRTPIAQINDIYCRHKKEKDLSIFHLITGSDSVKQLIIIPTFAIGVCICALFEQHKHKEHYLYVKCSVSLHADT